jgi:hypothetical protein
MAAADFSVFSVFPINTSQVYFVADYVFFRKKKRLGVGFWGLCMLCWLFAGALFPLYAGGKQDRDLSMADELIQEKRYDEAILILSDYSRRYPERFDQAQKRLRRIYRIRGNFNSLADRLLEVLINDPDNSAEILALTSRLEELENSSDPQLGGFISRTRELAQFNINRRRLEDIFVRGRSLLDQGNYQAALEVYAGGMDIYREEFFAAGYGSAVEQRVIEVSANINRAVTAFPGVSAPLGTAAAGMTRAVLESGRNADRLEETYSRLLPAMDRFIDVQRVLHESAAYFDGQLAELRAEFRTELRTELRTRNSASGDWNHLSFLVLLLRGRAGETVQEGMTGALEGYWNSAVRGLETAITRHTETMYGAGMAAAGRREYAAAESAFDSLRGYIPFRAALYEKHYELLAGGNPPVERLFEQPVLREDAGAFLKAESLNQALDYLVRAAALGSRTGQPENPERLSLEPWRSGAVSADAAMGREEQTRNGVDALLNEIEDLLVQMSLKAGELRNYRDNLAETGDFDILAYINDAQAVTAGLRVQVIAEARRSAERYYRIAGGDFERRLENRRGEFAEGNRFIQGLSRETGDGTAVIDHYPADGLAVLDRMAANITADAEWAGGLLERYGRERPEILSGGEIDSMRRSAQAMAAELNSLRNEGLALSADARNQIARAETYRAEGERLYREAQAAVNREAFDTAKERVQRAADRFSSSLAIQESASLRTAWDTQLISLSQGISRLENEAVIRDVRELVTSARSTYFAGNFEQAEALLIRAQNRWRVTNTGDDPEVYYWLGTVRGVLSLRSGRVILPTAPLYPEMSQLLSEAKQNYEEGVRFLNTGRRVDGIAKFDEAREKTREVKLMFPVNQDAGMLDLRMDQVTDPGVFNASFEQRIRQAIARTRQRSLEAFAELQNLAEINPRYPEIAAILTQAEIDMGYRLPPPDSRAIARSRELTGSARRILDGNIMSQYEAALTQINEAITLNPNNADATRIKDRLLTRMTVPGATVLNSQDEAEYQRAVRELQQGNYLVAMTVARRILDNPRNRNITKVLELQRRIELLL